MSDTDDRKYVTMKLDQPWGLSEEKVRIFPPCEVKAGTPKSSVVVFVKNANATWRRKTIGYFDSFPYSGFVAWDDRNSEYAWHEVGRIDVPDAKDPDIPRPFPMRVYEVERGQPLARQEWRDDSHPSKRKRRSFVEWWASLGGSDDEGWPT